MTRSDTNPLPPGAVPREQLELLIDGTSIRSTSLKSALHDHLVEGIPATDACLKTQRKQEPIFYSPKGAKERRATRVHVEQILLSSRSIYVNFHN